MAGASLRRARRAARRSRRAQTCGRAARAASRALLRMHPEGASLPGRHRRAMIRVLPRGTTCSSLRHLRAPPRCRADGAQDVRARRLPDLRDELGARGAARGRSMPRRLWQRRLRGAHSDRTGGGGAVAGAARRPGGRSRWCSPRLPSGLAWLLLPVVARSRPRCGDLGHAAARTRCFATGSHAAGPPRTVRRAASLGGALRAAARKDRRRSRASPSTPSRRWAHAVLLGAAGGL